MLPDGEGLAMWRYSVIRQPEPLISKVTEVEYIRKSVAQNRLLCARALRPLF
jgi:hypothetical protein